MQSRQSRRCFAAYEVRSIDKLSARTTGRLGDIRPDTAHAIKETAKLALRYSTYLRNIRRTQALLSDDYGPAGAAGARAMPTHPPEPQDRLRDYGPEEAELPAAQDLSGTTGHRL
jgi:hypothetical protein